VLSTTYYVDGTNGKDTNNGSQADPWATIKHAVVNVPTAAEPYQSLMCDRISDTTHLTTLGVIQNSVDALPPARPLRQRHNLGKFDGVNTVNTDVLVKYTYLGDTNLDARSMAQTTHASTTAIIGNSAPGTTPI